MSSKLSEANGDLPNSARISFYSPVLPYLLSMLAAFLVSGSFETLRVFSEEALWLGFLFILLEISLRVFWGIFSDGAGESKNLRVVFLTMQFIGVFFIFCWYFYFRVPPNPYVDFAPRETSITVRIDTVSTGVNDSRYGVGTITDASPIIRDCVGSQVWYTISDGKNATKPNKNILVSQEVRLNGVLSATYPSILNGRGYYSNKPESRAFEKYIRGKFIYFKMYSRVADAEIVVPAQSCFEFFYKVKAYMDNSLSRFFDDGKSETLAARAYRAMILGDKNLLTKDQKRGYMDTGTMHVFSISGLHIGFAAAVLFFALSIFGASWKLSAFVAIPILYLYVCACGSPPSAVRAFAMIAFFWVALAFSRGMRPFSALVLSAFVALLVAPTQVFDAGFALSYSIVASIFIYSMPLYKYLTIQFLPRVERDGNLHFVVRIWRWVLAYLLASFCISFGALFVGAPFSARYFSYVAPMAIFYSPFFVSGAGIVVMLGFVGFALPEILTKILNEVSVFIVGAMSDIALKGANFWSGRIDVSISSTFFAYIITLGFLILSAVFAKKRNAFKRFALAPIFVACMMVISFLKNG